MEKCKYADDLWLKYNSVLANRKIALPSLYKNRVLIDLVIQKNVTLSSINNGNEKNDEVIKCLFYDRQFADHFGINVVS